MLVPLLFQTPSAFDASHLAAPVIHLTMIGATVVMIGATAATGDMTSAAGENIGTIITGNRSMAGAPLSFPAQYPNIYAYGKAHSLQVLPDAIAPTHASIKAFARRAAGPRVPVISTPLVSAQNAKSGRAVILRDERKKGAPHRRRGFTEAGAGYGTQSSKQ